MKPKKINYTPTFLKCLIKIPQSQLSLLIEKEKILRQNIFDPRFKTHKLKGKLSGFYTCSVSYHYRLVFHIEEEIVYLDAIGTHSVYKQ